MIPSSSGFFLFLLEKHKLKRTAISQQLIVLGFYFLVYLATTLLSKPQNIQTKCGVFEAAVDLKPVGKLMDGKN